MLSTPILSPSMSMMSMFGNDASDMGSISTLSHSPYTTLHHSHSSSISSLPSLMASPPLANQSLGPSMSPTLSSSSFHSRSSTSTSMSSSPLPLRSIITNSNTVQRDLNGEFNSVSAPTGAPPAITPPTLQSQASVNSNSSTNTTSGSGRGRRNHGSGEDGGPARKPPPTGSIKPGDTVVVRGTEHVPGPIQKYAGSTGTVLSVPVHPCTWYGVRMRLDNKEVKMRSSSFDTMAMGQQGFGANTRRTRQSSNGNSANSNGSSGGMPGMNAMLLAQLQAMQQQRMMLLQLHNIAAAANAMGGQHSNTNSSNEPPTIVATGSHHYEGKEEAEGHSQKDHWRSNSNTTNSNSASNSLNPFMFLAPTLLLGVTSLCASATRTMLGVNMAPTPDNARSILEAAQGAAGVIATNREVVGPYKPFLQNPFFFDLVKQFLTCCQAGVPQVMHEDNLKWLVRLWEQQHMHALGLEMSGMRGMGQAFNNNSNNVDGYHTVSLNDAPAPFTDRTHQQSHKAQHSQRLAQKTINTAQKQLMGYENSPTGEQSAEELLFQQSQQQIINTLSAMHHNITSSAHNNNDNDSDNNRCGRGSPKRRCVATGSRLCPTTIQRVSSASSSSADSEQKQNDSDGDNDSDEDDEPDASSASNDDERNNARENHGALSAPSSGRNPGNLTINVDADNTASNTITRANNATDLSSLPTPFTMAASFALPSPAINDDFIHQLTQSPLLPNVATPRAVRIAAASSNMFMESPHAPLPLMTPAPLTPSAGSAFTLMPSPMSHNNNISVSISSANNSAPSIPSIGTLPTLGNMSLAATPSHNAAYLHGWSAAPSTHGTPRNVTGERLSFSGNSTLALPTSDRGSFGNFGLSLGYGSNLNSPSPMFPGTPSFGFGRSFESPRHSITGSTSRIVEPPLSPSITSFLADDPPTESTSPAASVAQPSAQPPSMPAPMVPRGTKRGRSSGIFEGSLLMN